MVNECVEATEVPEVDPEFPALSELQLDDHLKTRIAIVKRLTHALVVQSPNLKTVEYRGYDLVKDIFDALSKGDGHMLLPDDYRRRVRATRAR